MTRDYLLELYNSDPEFVATYHGNQGWTAEQCADDSWENIKGLDLYRTSFGYVAVNRNDLIDRLAGFFIKPEFRTAETKAEFFSYLKDLMPGNFIACIHSSNDKAIKFLRQHGEITLNDKITTYIVFRQENL